MQWALSIVKALTRRELEVLSALWFHREGNCRELAEALCLTESAVRFHLHNIYQKLGVRGKVGLLLLCSEKDFGEIASQFRQ